MEIWLTFNSFEIFYVSDQGVNLGLELHKQYNLRTSNTQQHTFLVYLGFLFMFEGQYLLIAKCQWLCLLNRYKLYHEMLHIFETSLQKFMICQQKLFRSDSLSSSGTEDPKLELYHWNVENRNIEKVSQINKVDKCGGGQFRLHSLIIGALCSFMQNISVGGGD